MGVNGEIKSYPQSVDNSVENLYTVFGAAVHHLTEYNEPWQSVEPPQALNAIIVLSRRPVPPSHHEAV